MVLQLLCVVDAYSIYSHTSSQKHSEHTEDIVEETTEDEMVEEEDDDDELAPAPREESITSEVKDVQVEDASTVENTTEEMVANVECTSPLETTDDVSTLEESLSPTKRDPTPVSSPISSNEKEGEVEAETEVVEDSLSPARRDPTPASSPAPPLDAPSLPPSPVSPEKLMEQVQVDTPPVTPQANPNPNPNPNSIAPELLPAYQLLRGGVKVVKGGRNGSKQTRYVAYNILLYIYIFMCYVLLCLLCIYYIDIYTIYGVMCNVVNI